MRVSNNLSITGYLIAGALLGGCVSNTQPVRPCCYEGPVSLTTVSSLRLVTEDGSELRVEDAFTGYQPQVGAFTRSPPFKDADIGRVAYARIRAIFPVYDANQNNQLEEPELTVLYLVEGARAFGHSVTGVRASPNTGAVVLPKTEFGGLLVYLEQNRDAMDRESQRLFFELELLGRDLRIDSPGPGDDIRINL